MWWFGQSSNLWAKAKLLCNPLILCWKLYIVSFIIPSDGGSNGKHTTTTGGWFIGWLVCGLVVWSSGWSIGGLWLVACWYRRILLMIIPTRTCWIIRNWHCWTLLLILSTHCSLNNLCCGIVLYGYGSTPLETASEHAINAQPSPTVEMFTYPFDGWRLTQLVRPSIPVATLPPRRTDHGWADTYIYIYITSLLMPLYIYLQAGYISW